PPPCPLFPYTTLLRPGVLRRWTGRGTDATSYAIWRLPSEQAREKDLADRRNLVATMRDDGPGLQEFVHDGADGSGWYVVTAYRPDRKSTRLNSSHVSI